jgi:hypothetical protein
MQTEHIVWMILAAAISLPFSLQNPVYIYSTSGIIIALVFALLFLWPRQPLPDMSGTLQQF